MRKSRQTWKIFAPWCDKIVSFISSENSHETELNFLSRVAFQIKWLKAWKRRECRLEILSIVIFVPSSNWRFTRKRK